MYNYNDIKTVHLEVTENCQSRCAMCGRYESDGRINHHLKNTELSLADCKKIFSKDFLKQLTRLYMCGNYGDPITAKDTLEIFEYFRYSNIKLGLQMFTNGGARNSQWWKDLASILYTSSCKTVFAIDGLKDTNHIYREGVVWDNVMNAAESFIAAGGKAHWVFIVFKHNEHQVEEAEKLAKKMGFVNFTAKKTSRFEHDKPFLKHLAPPTQARYLSIKQEAINNVINQYGSTEAFLNQTKIDCMVNAEKSIYVSAEGLLLPCCWIASDINNHTHKSLKDSEVFNLIQDLNLINAKEHSIEDIFKTKFFDKIEKSWSCSSMTEGKLKTCARTCSSEYNFFRDQFNT